MKEKRELIRVVKNKDGQIQLDDTGKLAGRGAYVCKNRECFTKALKNKGFERSFQSIIPVEIMERLSEEMISFETQ